MNQKKKRAKSERVEPVAVTDAEDALLTLSRQVASVVADLESFLLSTAGEASLDNAIQVTFDLRKASMNLATASCRARLGKNPEALIEHFNIHQAAMARSFCHGSDALQ